MTPQETGDPSATRGSAAGRLVGRVTDTRAFPYAALLPAGVLVLGLMIAPIVLTIYHSFTNWDGLTSIFTGLTNYRLLFSNPIIGKVLVNSLIFLISVPLILLVSLIVGVLVYEKVVGWKLFRFLFFIPNVLSPVIVGSLFSTFVLAGRYRRQGPVGLRAGTVRLAAAPMGGPRRRDRCPRLELVRASEWSSCSRRCRRSTPRCTTPPTIDGAGWWRRLWSITVPMISGSLQFLSVINVIYTFTSMFSFVYVITAGGPGFATTTVDYYTYTTTFENGQFGYGAALAVLLFLIVLALTALQIKLFPSREVQQGA